MMKNFGDAYVSVLILTELDGCTYPLIITCKLTHILALKMKCLSHSLKSGHACLFLKPFNTCMHTCLILMSIFPDSYVHL